MSDFAAFEFAWLKQIRIDRKNLPAPAGWLAMTFCEYLNRKNRTAWPSVNRLAGDLGLTGRCVQNTVNALVERGHLMVEKGGGRGRTNRYNPILKTLNEASLFEAENTAERLNDCSPISAKERVNCGSGFSTERVNGYARKGEQPFQKRVNSRSPDSIEENLLKEPNAAGGSANAAFFDPTSTPNLFPSRQVSNSGKGAPGNSAADHKTELFRRAKEILGPKKGGMITKLLAAMGGEVALARAALESASIKADPAEYLGAVISKKSARSNTIDSW